MPAATTGGLVAGRIRQLQAERPHMTRCTKLLCSAFLTVLLVVGVALFVAYLAVRPHRPRFHVTAFSAAGIPSGGAVALSVRNRNHDVAFLLDRLYMSVQYRDAEVVKDYDLTGAPLYQAPKTTSAVAFQGVEVVPASASGDMARDAAGGSDDGEGAVEDPGAAGVLGEPALAPAPRQLRRGRGARRAAAPGVPAEAVQHRLPLGEARDQY